MSGAWFLPANLHAYASSKVRRLAAWLAASASDPQAGLSLVMGFAAVHAVLWTLILIHLKAGPEIPARLRQASAAVGVGRGHLVHDVSGRQLVHLRIGDGDAWLRAGDLLADRVACGRPPPRLLRRGDAGALPDLQFQGLQVQSGSAATRDPAAFGAGLSACVRETHRARRAVARPCRRAGADDQILGADHDRRDRDRSTRSSRAVAVPAFAGAMGGDRHLGGRDASASVVVEAGRFRAADLRGRYLRNSESRAVRSACCRICRAQSGVASLARGAGRAGLSPPPMVAKPGPTAFGAIHAQLVSRPQSRGQYSGGVERLDHPDRGRNRAPAWRAYLHDLFEDRLGDLAVLSDPAGAGCDPVAAAAKDRTVSYCRDLAGVDARGACRLAHHRGP